MSRKALIVNADDCGLSPGVTRGIEVTHRQGLVTATSVMANTPFFSDCVNLLGRNPGLDPGVHLTLRPGTAVADPGDVPSLPRQDGRLGRRSTFWGALLTGSIRRAEVEREWRAQIEKVLEAGIAPSHLDSHGHVHFLPPLFELTAQLADEYGIPVVRGGRPLLRPVGRRLPVWLILILNWCLVRNCLDKHGVASARSLAGVSVTGHLHEQELSRLLWALPGGVTELVCHPGYEDRELLRSGDPRLPGRTSELQALCRVEVPARVTLTTFRAEWATPAGEPG